MDIKYIRLQNFKGFKDATLKLKPLTVLLGPNSSGKSCFGQALVALSKSNAKNDILSLAFDQNSSVEFGDYSDLVHHGCEGKNVIIELELRPATVSLGFGPADIKARINELELKRVDISEQDHIEISTHEPDSGSVSQIIETPFPDIITLKKLKTINRQTDREWTVLPETASGDKGFNFKFRGIEIDSVSRLTGTAIDIDKDVKLLFNLLASLFRGISYLRPDRERPLRKKTIPSSAEPNIDDWGIGTDWFIHVHEKKGLKVDTFFFPEPTTDKDESKATLAKYREYLKLEPQQKGLLEALTSWLKELGLASFLDIKLLAGEPVTQAVATPIGQQDPRSLRDLGFGVSQVLPILVKGLTIKKGDLLIVEQPEAQLHPKPQAVLADFFCSMVKCTRNVIVETHSVELFHRIRLRAAMDENLAKQIAVYFFDEPKGGVCCEPIPISLKEEDELRWPNGFLPEGIQKEMEILATRLAKRDN
jgi:hypothetical protein